MEMLGFADIEASACHRAVGRGLAAHRAAYIARRRSEEDGKGYYHHVGHDFPIGRAR
jgi:hypothetical protein